jgi:hypothetical protein
MRDDFQGLYDKINNAEFDGVFTKAEYAKLLVGAYIISNNLQDKLKVIQSALKGYTNLAPKLQEIIDEADDEAAQKKAEELLIIEEENSNT